MIKKLIFSIIIIISVIYFFVNSLIGNDKFKNLKSLLNYEQRQSIKEYIFPYKTLSLYKQKINRLEKDNNNLILNLENRKKNVVISEHKYNSLLSVLELNTKDSGEDIIIKENIVKLSNNKILKKYKLTSGFYAGIHEQFPGSGYIEFYEDNIFALSSRGVLVFRKNIDDDEENFKQIKNNINDFIGLNQFKKGSNVSLKDLFISNNKIFISYTDEIKEDCWNTSIIFGNINYDNIKFKKLFSPRGCVHSVNNRDKEFQMTQSGGKIISLNANHILLSIGDYRSRYLAQDYQSVNGKIVKINIINKDYKIISMGHRNPQGLYFDKENNFILETEHGPMGGDEINLIEVNEINNIKIPNYGWAISSAGEHYGGKNESNKNKYEKYPLYKSHSDHGFIEPLYSFVPSIGISEIVKIGQNKYVVSSLKDKSLYFFEMNEKNQIINLNRISVSERVRDLRFYNNQLYLFMENTASIGILNLD